MKGEAPVDGEHAGRLAVEQIYGYMVRNAVQLGIISTMLGWVFLWRQDQGQLYMTRMFACRPEIDGGYTVPQGLSIMQALYYFSGLAEISPILPETTGGQAGRVQIDQAATQTPAAAPTIRITQNIEFVQHNSQQRHSQTPGQQFVLKNSTKELSLIFESWKVENRLGEKTWRCRLLPDDDVVIKIWDSWRCDSSARDHEVDVYMRLQSLWGKVVPSLIASAPIHFFHGFILKHIEVFLIIYCLY